MALLGHSSRIVISTTEIETSVEAWLAVGFEIESESNGRMRLTDNQILITIMSDEFNSPGLVYFTDKDGSEAEEPDKVLSAPGGLQLFSHRRSALQAALPTREQSPLLGYFDALVVGVDSVEQAKQWSEGAGFFIQDEWGAPHKQVDVTDGLSVISFRELQSRPFLAYSADIDNELVRLLTEAAPNRTQVYSNAGDVDRIKITMPEGTVIMVFDDSLGTGTEE